MRPLLLSLLALFFLACDDRDEGTQVLFDLNADWSRQEAFYDFPFPSDLRLAPNGAPDYGGFPYPHPHDVIDGLLRLASERKGFPVVPVAYFRFQAPLAPRDPEAVIPASASQPLLLVDVDPASPERGKLFPLVAAVAQADPYAPENVLAVAARPGFILHPGRKYAFVVMRDFKDASGARLGVPPALVALEDGDTPEGARGQAAYDLYAPLWETLADKLELDVEEVAAATVFTTGDVVADLAALSTRVLERHHAEVTDLHLDPTDGASHERFCELKGWVRFPQFQKGTPPFNTQGSFDIGADGVPVQQREESVPIVITIPREPMPASGYPLMIYFHGSGGESRGVVDRGRTRFVGDYGEPGKGPAHVVAAFGIAAASSALPVNPERLPSASETAYLNFANLSSFRDIFRQGAIEQRLLVEALRSLEIPPSALDGCSGPALPGGASAFRFDLEKLVASGQSMGGMYANIVGAIEPRIRAVVPTGAGGFWSYFVTKSTLIADMPTLIALVLKTEANLTFMHPALALLQAAWEPADPLVYMPRLARRPLAGHPVRPIYEPVAKDDSYFPTVLYDAVALAYGHPQAGAVVWPSMQDALGLAGLSGVLSFPVKQNLRAESGAPYTGVVVQFEGDGLDDPHAIYRTREDVKHQYGCFLSTFLATGVAVVPPPADTGTACAQP